MLTILIARDRKTGKDIILADRQVPFAKQLELRNELENPNEKYSDALMLYVTPAKAPLKFSTKKEIEDREEAHKAQVAKAEADAKKAVAEKAKAEKEAAAAGEKSAKEGQLKTIAERRAERLAAKTEAKAESSKGGPQKTVTELRAERLAKKEKEKA